jgi:hypothetical protein
MTRRLTTLFLALNAVGVLLPAFGDEMSARTVEVVHTERVSFAPGGVIHVSHSFGSVTVEGWDRPEVDVTVVKSRERYYEPKQHEQAARGLERVRVAELTGCLCCANSRRVSLRGPRRGFRHRPFAAPA